MQNRSFVFCLFLSITNLYSSDEQNCKSPIFLKTVQEFRQIYATTTGLKPSDLEIFLVQNGTTVTIPDESKTFHELGVKKWADVIYRVKEDAEVRDRIHSTKE